MIIDAAAVVEIHDFILSKEPGLPGFCSTGTVESVLARINNKKVYEGLEDVFEIAGWYAVAIAKGHVFNDGNKRTALLSALAYLYFEGFEVAITKELATMMEHVASGVLGVGDVANIFASTATRIDAQSDANYGEPNGDR